MMTDILKSFKHPSTTDGKKRFSELRWLIVSNEPMKKWISTVCACHAEEDSQKPYSPAPHLSVSIGRLSKERQLMYLLFERRLKKFFL